MFSSRTLSLAVLAGTTLLPSLVQGIAFTSPAPSDVVTKGSEVTAKWTTVDTDPSVFSLYIWNFAAWPPYYEGLAYGVDTAAGEVTVRVPCHVDAGAGWQFTAINDTNVYVLYAQTDAFNITGDACVDAPASASCYAPTSTVYVTQTAGNVPATTASAATSIITAAIIQPGIVDGTKTSQPTVAATTAAALISLDIAIDI